MMDIWGGPSGANRFCQREERGRHSFEPYNYRWKLPPLSVIPYPILPDGVAVMCDAPLKAYAVQGCRYCNLTRLLEYPSGRPFWYGRFDEMDAAIGAWNNQGRVCLVEQFNKTDVEQNEQ
jgi:hypothetical protein